MSKLQFSTKPIIIKNDILDNVIFKFIYPTKLTNEERCYLSLLQLIMNTTTKKYPKEEDYTKEQLRKTILSMGISKKRVIDNVFISYDVALPKQGLVSDYDMEESFDFAMESFFNPYVKNGSFIKEKFDREKDFLIHDTLEQIRGIYAVNFESFWNIVDEDNIIGLSSEERVKVLKSITPKKLYDFYIKYIKNNKPIIYVYGNIEEEYALKLINKYYGKEERINITTSYFKPLKVVPYKRLDFKTNFAQTQLVMEYVADIKEEDIKYLMIITDLLSGRENRLVFEKLRIENGLVYQTMVDGQNRNSVIVISAFLDINNVEKAVNMVNEIFESLKDKKYLNKCLKKLKKGTQVDVKHDEDNIYFEFNERVFKDLNLISIKSMLDANLYNDLDKIIEIINKISLGYVVVYEGVSSND